MKLYVWYIYILIERDNRYDQLCCLVFFIFCFSCIVIRSPYFEKYCFPSRTVSISFVFPPGYLLAVFASASNPKKHWSSASVLGSFLYPCCNLSSTISSFRIRSFFLSPSSSLFLSFFDYFSFSLSIPFLRGTLPSPEALKRNDQTPVHERDATQTDHTLRIKAKARSAKQKIHSAANLPHGFSS